MGVTDFTFFALFGLPGSSLGPSIHQGLKISRFFLYFCIQNSTFLFKLSLRCSIVSMLYGRPQCQNIRGAAVARRMASSIQMSMPLVSALFQTNVLVKIFRFIVYSSCGQLTQILLSLTNNSSPRDPKQGEKGNINKFNRT